MVCRLVVPDIRVLIESSEDVEQLTESKRDCESTVVGSNSTYCSTDDFDVVFEGFHCEIPRSRSPQRAEEGEERRWRLEIEHSIFRCYVPRQSGLGHSRCQRGMKTEETLATYPRNCSTAR
jgi:hypothetical protein